VNPIVLTNLGKLTYQVRASSLSLGRKDLVDFLDQLVHVVGLGDASRLGYLGKIRLLGQLIAAYHLLHGRGDTAALSVLTALLALGSA
jgi:hypothetical protein